MPNLKTMVAFPIAACVLMMSPPGLLARSPALTATQPDSEPATPLTIPIRSALVAGPFPSGGRHMLPIDPVESRWITTGPFAPAEGESIPRVGLEPVAWRTLAAGDDGALADPALGSGYAYVRVAAPTDRVMILNARGHGMVYVEGSPRTGDPYSNGAARLPVLIRQTGTDLLFAVGRGRLAGELNTPRGPALIDTADSTLPDVLPHDAGGEVLAAVILINATDRPADGWMLHAAAPGTEPVLTAVPTLPPLGTHKLGFAIPIPRPLPPGETLPVEIALHTPSPAAAGGDSPADQARLTLRLRSPEQTFTRTFRSGIDGSVQYYAVRPPIPPAGAGSPPLALVLSLHGASVEAISQADAYAPKPWAVIVAPTNRRPFGFDWEDWGRLDALEVLAEARRSVPIWLSPHNTGATGPDTPPAPGPSFDPAQTYLTGHSMGGHGTWQLGAHFPGLFAALGPSAGWISFATYGGGLGPAPSSPAEAMIARASLPSNTLALTENLTNRGIFILHGDADDNVPVAQARQMRDALEPFHRDLMYHEQPGAGHWWESSPEAGAECLDWPAMFDFFARRRLPESSQVRRVHFTTAHPGVSADMHWVRIQSVRAAFEPAWVDITIDPFSRRLAGATGNVEILTILAADSPLRVTAGTTATVSVELDGQAAFQATPGGDGKLHLRRSGEDWLPAEAPSTDMKGPHRAGPFKDAFRHGFVLVYATAGDPDENAWALAKARYDAETFRYRGNGAPLVISDAAFVADPLPGRSVILYGNADTNRAWPVLLRAAPISVRRGMIDLGGKPLAGEGRAALFIVPRPAPAPSEDITFDPVASVAVLAPAGSAGERLLNRLPIFTSGVAIPDYVLLDGVASDRPLRHATHAGFFTNAWQLPPQTP